MLEPVIVKPEIDAAEVERLLSKLNSRINDLTLRQESAEDPASVRAGSQSLC